MNKKYILLIFISVFTLTLNAQEIPNGNFEEWEDFQGINFEFPTGWITSSFAGVGAGLENNAVKVTDSHNGSYAIKLVTVEGYYPNEPLIGTAIYDGALDKSPTVLQGYYKSNIMDNDAAYISIDVISGGDFIGGAVIEFTSDKSDYTYFSVPIDYIVSNPQADYYYLSILSSDDEGVIGTSITVDDLRFDGSTAVVDAKDSQIELSLSPNPVSNVLDISIDDNSEQVEVFILNIFGQVVDTKKMIQNASFDVSGYTAGYYLVEVVSQNKHVIQSKQFAVGK